MSAIGNSAGGYPVVKFTSPGDNHWGYINNVRDMQVTDFKTKKPQFYEDGNPVLQTVLTIEKQDGDLYRIFVKPGEMRNAAVQALNSAQAADVEMGGLIKFTYLGLAPAKNGGEKKTYSCNYKKPDGSYVPKVREAAPEPEPAMAASAPDDPWNN